MFMFYQNPCNVDDSAIDIIQPCWICWMIKWKSRFRKKFTFQNNAWFACFSFTYSKNDESSIKNFITFFWPKKIVPKMKENCIEHELRISHIRRIQTNPISGYHWWSHRMTINPMVTSFIIGRKTESAIQIINIRHTKFILYRSIQMFRLTEKEFNCNFIIMWWTYFGFQFMYGLSYEVTCFYFSII